VRSLKKDRNRIIFYFLLNLFYRREFDCLSSPPSSSVEEEEEATFEEDFCSEVEATVFELERDLFQTK
jgi:hypothetical protein